MKFEMAILRPTDENAPVKGSRGLGCTKLDATRKDSVLGLGMIIS